MAIDDRFSYVSTDPRFKKLSKKERKVKIDSRFEKMFTDKRFHTKFTVDKRGKPLREVEKEDLHKFYELDADSLESNDIKDISEVETKENAKQNKKKKRKEIELSRSNNIKGASGTATKEDTKQIKKKKIKEVELSESNNIKGPNETVTNGNTKQKKKKKRKGAADEGIKPKKAKNEENEHKVKSKKSKNEKEKDISTTEKDRTKTETTFDDIRGEKLDDDYLEYDSDITVSDIDENDVEEGIVHGWGSLDENVKRIENAESTRLAVCNLDWDRITANDLFVLFNSFKPTGGSIKSVKIYPSQYGIERMKEEELEGPKELKDTKFTNYEEDEGEEGTTEVQREQMEKLREYQLNRMKYYYAVAECNDIGTANKIYEECDGMEYEMSSTRLDLRFIPDDMTFDIQPKSEATDMPNAKHYEPATFLNTALQQSTVRLTWDESDPKRLQNTMRKFTQEDLENMDFKDYLASSSEEEGFEEDENEESADDDEKKRDVDKKKKSEEDLRIEKYRILMKEIEEKECQENADEGDIEMEINWDEKVGEEDEEYSDNEIEDVGKEEAKDTADKEDGFNDPFSESNEAVESDNKRNEKNKKKKNKKKMKQDEKVELTKEEKQKKGELELLMLDESEDKKHFSYKDILENEKSKKSKRKRRKNKDKLVKEKDEFEVDVKDERFNALFSSHLYAIDPSEPNFKKSKATDAIISEVQRRRAEENQINEKSQAKDNLTTIDSSLSTLVQSVKSKAASHQEKKKKKKLK